MLMSFQTEGTANTTPRVSRNTEEAQVGGDGGEGGNGVGRRGSRDGEGGWWVWEGKQVPSDLQATLGTWALTLGWEASRRF